MFQLAKIERILHPCLQIDCSDEILWPLIDDEEIGRIQSIRDVWCKLVYCYPYLRKNSDGILYIDIYLLDTRS